MFNRSIYVRNETQHNFIRAFDTCADEIFAYCYKKVAHHEIASYLTGTIFTRTWDYVSAAEQAAALSVRNLRAILNYIAREELKSFVRKQESEQNYKNNLWSLTLAQ